MLFHQFAHENTSLSIHFAGKCATRATAFRMLIYFQTEGENL